MAAKSADDQPLQQAFGGDGHIADIDDKIRNRDGLSHQADRPSPGKFQSRGPSRNQPGNEDSVIISQNNCSPEFTQTQQYENAVARH